jgi:hypothetical protein
MVHCLVVEMLLGWSSTAQHSTAQHSTAHSSRTARPMTAIEENRNMKCNNSKNLLTITSIDL